MKLRLMHVVSGSAVLAGAIAAAVAAPPASRVNPLRVSMVAASGSAADFLGAVEITITNTSRHTVRLPRWQLPSDYLEGKLFNVSLDGAPVQYEGPMFKRGLPQPADFAILRAGETYRTVVDLSAAYDLSRTGQYTVSFNSPLQHASTSDGAMLKQSNGLPMMVSSAPLRLWVDGSDQLGAAKSSPAAKKPPPSGGGTVVNGVTYKGCTTTQTNTAGNAVVSARGYSENAKGYLGSGTIGPRYTTWFGGYTSQRYSTASQHFVTARWTKAAARSPSTAAATKVPTPTSIRPGRTRSSSAARSGPRR